jgi:regulatory protein SWI5
MMATAAPPYRGHRRGQTVDYGSFGPEIAIDRRNTPKTVTQLCDFYNEKSAIPCQQATVQQNQAYFPVDERQFVPADLPAHQTYQFPTPTAVRDQCQAFTHEQLQAIHAQVGDMTPSRMASSLSRPRSQCSETASLNGHLNHIHQGPERLRRNLRSNQHPIQAHVETDDWELFPQQCLVGVPPNVAISGRHNRQHVAVKAEDSPEMSHAHISSSCMCLCLHLACTADLRQISL